MGNLQDNKLQALCMNPRYILASDTNTQYVPLGSFAVLWPRRTSHLATWSTSPWTPLQALVRGAVVILENRDEGTQCSLQMNLSPYD